MTLRKLTPPEIAAPCACLALPEEWGHDPECPHYQAKRKAYRLRHAQKWRAKRRTVRLDTGA